MKEGVEKGRYIKGGFGLHQNLVLLMSLAAFMLAFFFGTVNDSDAEKQFEALKNSNLVLSDEKIADLEKLSTQDDVSADFVGQYAYLVDYGSGLMLRGDIDIDENSISRSISISHLSMYASADYRIDGATVQYSNVTGDKYLFSEHGTAIGDDLEYGVFLEIDGDMKLFVKTQYAKDDYKPYSKESAMNLSERLKRMSFWSYLQLFFGVIGVGILLFIFVSIFRDNRSGSNENVMPA